MSKRKPPKTLETAPKPAVGQQVPIATDAAAITAGAAVTAARITRKGTIIGAIVTAAAVILVPWITYRNSQPAAPVAPPAAQATTSGEGTRSDGIPPPDPLAYPPPPISLPPQVEADQPTKLEPKAVTFRYKNATGIDMILWIFDCSHHYHKRNKAGFLDNPSWQPWAFPASKDFKSYSGFTKGSIFIFMVERIDSKQRTEFPPIHLFDSPRPTLTVKNNGGSFTAEFRAEE